MGVRMAFNGLISPFICFYFRLARSRTSTKASTGALGEHSYGALSRLGRKFNLIIAGLDNIAARRWINATLHDMVDRTSGEPDPSASAF